MTKGLAVVTGGSSGIGRQVCLQLSRLEYEVLNVSRSKNPKEGGRPTSERHPNISFLKLDLSLGFYEELWTAIGSRKWIILVSNAGELNLDEDAFEYQEVVRYTYTNFLSHYILGKEALRRGVESIVFTSSISALHGEADAPLYSSCKAALVGLTKSLSARGPGSVNCIAPGFVDTKLVAGGEPLPKKFSGYNSSSEEVANAIVFLLHNKALNGATLTIDKGLSSKLWRWE